LTEVINSKIHTPYRLLTSIVGLQKMHNEQFNYL